MSSRSRLSAAIRVVLGALIIVCVAASAAQAAAPSITSILPTAAANTGSVTISFTGTGMDTVNAALLRKTGTGAGTINDIPGTAITPISAFAAQATFNLTSVAPGSWQVRVSNPEGDSNFVNFTVTASAPVLTSATPSSRGQGASNQNIVIAGSNFFAGATVTSNGVGITVNSTTVNSTSSATANISVSPTATVGGSSFTLTNTDAQSGSCIGNCFTVNAAPTVASTDKSLGQGASNQNVVVTGTGFAGSMTVAFGAAGVTVNNNPITPTNATTFTANVTVSGTATTGAGSITVTNGDAGVGSCATCFTVNPKPTATSVSPTSYGQGATSQLLTITGTNFNTAGTGVVVNAGAGVTVNNNPVLASATQVVANITVDPLATPGVRTVTVTNPDSGTPAQCVGCFTVNAKPTITSAAPSTLGIGATHDVVLTGTGFAAGAGVTIAGLTVNGSPVVNNATTITVNVTVPGGAATGNHLITVTNTDLGVGTCAACLSVGNGPAITTVAPSALGQGATSIPVTVTGTGFACPGATGTLTGTGITINSQSCDSSTQVTMNLTVASNATTGARTLTITNADFGQATSTLTINAAPIASSVTPPTPANTSSAQTITVNGSGFVSGPLGSLTLRKTNTGAGSIPDIACTTWTFGSANAVSATCDINAVAPGTWTAIVANGDAGIPTANPTFTITGSQPTVTSIAPSSRGQGASAQAITINGTNFFPGDVVAFTLVGPGTNGLTFTQTGRTTTAITGTLTVSPTAATGNRSVTVTNTDSQVNAPPATFTVNAAPTVTSVSPAAASNVGSVSLTMTGTGFDNSTGSVLLHLTGQSDIPGTSYNRVSATQATASFNINGVAPGNWDVQLTNGDAGGPAICSGCFTIGASAPTVTSIVPASRGKGATNQTVTIGGGNFATGAVLSFSPADITINSSSVTNATTMTANITVPAGAASGPHNVIVTNTDTQVGSCIGCFTVNPTATVTSASPASRGQGATNQDITLNGTNFIATPAVTLTGGTINGIVINSTTWLSPTQVKVNINVAANATPGVRTITLTNPDGSPGVTCGGTCFSVNASPTVTSASPSSRGQGATNQDITVNGTNFLATPTVTFTGGATNGITINSTTLLSASQVKVNIDIASGASTGARTINLTNPDGSPTVTCSSCFTVNAAPTATSGTPNNLGQGATNQNITVAGTGFSGTPVVSFGPGITVNSVSGVTGIQLTANIDVTSGAATGARAFTVTNPDGGVATCANCFTVNTGPTVSTVSPNNRGQGATNQNLTVTGTGFAGTPTVTFSGSGITVNSVSGVTATQLTVNIDVSAGAAAGARALTVTNADFGSATCGACFTVNAAPTAISATPNDAGQGAVGRSVVIAGTNFIGTPAVSFGSLVTVNSVTRDSSTQLTVSMDVDPAAATGARNFTVSNADGSPVATCVTCFTIDAAPTATAASPNNLGQGATGQTIAVTGTGFTGTPGVAFSGSGITVNSVTPGSATTLSVDVTVDPAAATGARTLTVTNPDGGVANCSCFTVNAGPSLTSISPTSRGQGATGEVITLNGANFSATPDVVFSGSDITVGTITRLSATQLTVSIDIDPAAATTSRDITVTNDDAGIGSCIGCFTVNPGLSVTSATPDNYGQGASSQTISVVGSGFNGTPTASFSGSGITVNSVTPGSATALDLNISIAPSAATGARTLRIINPDGGVGTCGCFTVNTGPTATSASPSSRGQGASHQTVTVTGTGFTGASAVSIGGTGITIHSVTPVSGTSMDLDLSVDPGAAVGARDLTVTNADAGRAVCVGCFSVNAAPTVTSASPPSAPDNAPVMLTLTGTNFDTSSGSALLRRAGQSDIAGTGYNRVSATQVQATFDLTSAAPGAWDVRLTNADAGGPAVCGNCVTITSGQPTVTTVTPSSRGRGASNQALAIVGTNFANGASVSFGGSGITLNSTTPVDATHINVNVSVSPTADLGSHSVTVTNTDAQFGSCSCLTINDAPTITTVSPNSRARGATNEDLVVAGTGFNGVPQASFSSTGVTVNGVTLNSPAQLTVNVTVSNSAPVGSRDLTVVNGDGGPVTKTNAFSVTAPARVAITKPSSLGGSALATFNQDVTGVAGSNFVLRLTGSGTNLPGALACKTASGASTACNSSTVRTATLTPAVSLTSGQRYTLIVNPAGAATVVQDGSGGPVPTTTSSFRASQIEQESSTGATYVWQTDSASAALGGSYTTERDAGARATYTFTGTSVIWYTITGSDQGLASVSLDGVAKGIFNNYATGRHFNVTHTFAASGNGPHTLQIYVKGQKGNASATAPYVTIDAFRPGSGTVQTTPPVLYRWRTASVGGATVASTDSPGARVTFTFRGTGIDWYTVFGHDQGKASVYIDGVLVRNVDDYRSSTFVARHLFRGLSDTVHTIRMFVSTGKNAASTGTAIGVDRFIVY